MIKRMYQEQPTKLQPGTENLAPDNLVRLGFIRTTFNKPKVFLVLVSKANLLTINLLTSAVPTPSEYFSLHHGTKSAQNQSVLGGCRLYRQIRWDLRLGLVTLPSFLTSMFSNVAASDVFFCLTFLCLVKYLPTLGR